MSENTESYLNGDKIDQINVEVEPTKYPFIICDPLTGWDFTHEDPEGNRTCLACITNEGIHFNDCTAPAFKYSEATQELSFSGFTTTPSDMVQLTKSGRMVTMSFLNGFNSTYQSGIPRSQQPLPQDYIPQTPKVIPCLIENSLAMVAGYLMVDEQGYISWYPTDPETLSPQTPAGIPQGLTVIYTV